MFIEMPPCHTHDTQEAVAFEELLESHTTEARRLALLEHVSSLPVSAQRLASWAGALRDKCISVPDVPTDAIDVCGTGGDHSGTFNISTAAAIVAAGAGMTVAKHGNRSVSSRCGSSDCLEALGVPTGLGPRACSRLLRQIGLAFLFAPRFHPAVSRVMTARRVLAARGCKTVFNLLGPLANPAAPARQALGVRSVDLIEPMMSALQQLGVHTAMVYHGEGLDEITPCGTTEAAVLRNGRVIRETLHPNMFGMQTHNRSSLAGGDAVRNADIVRGVLSGALYGGCRDAVVLNAAAGITVGSTSPLSFDQAVARAQEAIDSGAAIHVLDAFVRATRVHGRMTQ